MVKQALRGLWATCVCATLSAAPALAATSDVVLYATDATNVHGNWKRVSDTSAAGGQMLSSTDKRWASPDVALASPADYFDFSFQAPAGVAYRVWVRLRASGNSKTNDSVFGQFSDALSVSGTPVYGLGTTNGLVLNLQPCKNCAFSGWGWVGGAYWLTQVTTVKFASTGTHTFRIQTREDGVQLDQVVVSPTTYLSTAPGQAMNDATIVPKPAATGVPTPFYGTALTVPGTIQAEDFDNGGEGVAYHDSEAGNSGGQYRQTDVDVEASTEGGYDVGYISAGEWLNYTVNVASAGSYLLEARVASNGQGGTFHLESAGTDVTGAMTIPNTGGWQTWTTLTKAVTLAAGTRSVRLVFDTATAGVVGNVNWLRFSAATISAAAAPTPYSGTAMPLPGTIAPEKFDNGGEGVAYHDTTPGNAGGAARQTDVDLEASSAGGYDVGWIDAGEWLAYTVNVAVTGNYTVQFAVASMTTGSQFHAVFGTTATGLISVPNTGGWQSWTTVSIPVTLSAGQQVLKVVADVGGYNLGNIVVAAAAAPAPTPPPSPTPTPPPPPPPSASPYAPPAAPAGGATWTVNAGGDLQAALNAAQPGDTILLQAGATFSGNFVLPMKGGGSYITIRSSAPDASLPDASTRISPAYAPLLPKLQSPNSSAVLVTAPGAHHYRLQALEFLANYQGYGDVVDLGDGSSAQNTLSLVPHDLVVDRVYIHGDVTYGQKRGIGLNSGTTWVANSYIAEIKAVGQDSQAICGWNGPGPFVVWNNYLEAAGENILFGGADAPIPNLVPSDIKIVQNYIAKQLAWKTQTQWSVKNLLELKNAQRVSIDGNLLEYNWLASQSGYSVLFTPRNQDGNSPWSVVQQVAFTNNVVRHVASGINILGTDNLHPSQQTNNIVVRNNLFDDVSKTKYGGDGRFAIVQGGANFTFDHNTVFEDGSSALFADVSTVTGFVFTNNIVPDNSWAIIGTGTGPGNPTIAAYFPQGQFLGGIYIASPAWNYPTGNYYPANAGAVGFVDVAGGNYRLSSSSPYHNGATDGTDVGCNIDGLNAVAGTRY